MKKFVGVLCLLLILGLVGCGGDEASDPNLSAEGKAVTEELGGPFDVAEFKRFMKDLPSIAELTAAGQQAMGTDSGAAALNTKVRDAVKALGWDEERFMYIYSHSMAVFSMDQMDKMNAQMQAQMDGLPEAQKKMMAQMMAEQVGDQMEAIKAEVDSQVPGSEQAIIRDNMGELEKAFGIQSM